jgi:uncharacterized protein YecT (DUF1311 family)
MLAQLRPASTFRRQKLGRGNNALRCDVRKATMARNLARFIWRWEMRAIGLAIIAIQVGLTVAGKAETAAEPDRSITGVLPLLVKNRCDDIRNPADQMFCGDPELNAVDVKLNAAIAARLNRIPNRNLAVVENAEWIRERNSSCGILGRLSVKGQEIKAVRDCLLKETKERIDILSDPNFDCLANNTTAGRLICSDPSLALAKTRTQ